MSIATDVIENRLGLGLERLARHLPDTARGWPRFHGRQHRGHGPLRAPRRDPPLADDPHFGVREWSWMAIRPHLAADLDTAIALLSGWTVDSSDRICRFASEVIRPRGVWCAHISALKSTPKSRFPLLSRCGADPATYVQDPGRQLAKRRQQGPPRLGAGSLRPLVGRKLHA